jgi:hypothetical protein
VIVLFGAVLLAALATFAGSAVEPSVSKAAATSGG